MLIKREDASMEETDDFLNTMTTLEKTLKESHDWAIDRIHFLSERDIDDAYAIQSEFSEWFNLNIKEHNVISLEYLGE